MHSFITTPQKELTEASKEYRLTVQRIKSQQSLKNYHKQFKNNLVLKLSKTQGKHCMKISKHITPSLSSFENFNIWPIIFSLKSQRISLSIPPTLYRDSNCEFLVQPKGPDNILEFSTGFKINDYFCKGLPKYKNLPICIYKPLDGRIQLISSLDNLQSLLSSSSETQGYFQYFIPPCKTYCNILLSYCKKKGPVRCYIVQNTEEVPSIEKYDIRNPKKNTESDCEDFSILLRELSQKTLPFKERRLTYDFSRLAGSPVLIDHSSSSNKQFTNLAQRLRSIERPKEQTKQESFLDNNKSKLLVDLSNSRFLNTYLMKMNDPRIAYMNHKVFSLVDTHSKSIYGQNLEEISLVFVKDELKNWVLVKVNSLKYEQPFSSEEKMSNKESGNDNLSFNASFIEHSRPISNTLIPIMPNEKKNSITPIINPVIKIRSPEKIKVKSSYKAVRNKTFLDFTSSYQKCINDGVQNLEAMKMNIRQSKKDFIKLSSKYSASSFWKELNLNTFKKVFTTPLCKYFINIPNEKYHAISDGLFRVFCSDMGVTFQRYLAKVHKNLNITEGDYEEFKNIFIENLKFYIEDKTDLSVVEYNFSIIKPSIVFPIQNSIK